MCTGNRMPVGSRILPRITAFSRVLHRSMRCVPLRMESPPLLTKRAGWRPVFSSLPHSCSVCEARTLSLVFRREQTSFALYHSVCSGCENNSRVADTQRSGKSERDGRFFLGSRPSCGGFAQPPPRRERTVASSRRDCGRSRERRMCVVQSNTPVSVDTSHLPPPLCARCSTPHIQ